MAPSKVEQWALPRAQRERATPTATKNADWALPSSFERRQYSRGTRASRSRGAAPNGSRQYPSTIPSTLSDGNAAFSHVDFLRKATRMPSPSRQSDAADRRRSKREPQTPSFAQPTGRLRSGRGVGRAALTAQVRAQADLEEVIKGTDHLRDIRRQYEQLASTMRRAHTQSSRDDKRWHDRMDQNREDMRKKLQEARHHFAKELHKDQVSMERQKLRRNRKMAGSLACHRQAWLDFEATDWDSSGPIKLVRLCSAAAASRTVLQVMQSDAVIEGWADIPFPPDKHNALCVSVNATAADRKAAYREASLRWHPDKFFARWAKYIDPEERDQIVARVAETAQLVAESRRGGT